jgi:hypothetical protein
MQTPANDRSFRGCPATNVSPHRFRLSERFVFSAPRTAPWCNPAREPPFTPKRPPHRETRDMGLRINDTIPNLTVETDQGSFALHDWIGDSWAILFSHPKDFTPVCTTEFGAVARLADEWAKRGTKVIGVSVDGVEDHRKWKADIEAVGGAARFPDHRR